MKKDNCNDYEQWKDGMIEAAGKLPSVDTLIERGANGYCARLSMLPVFFRQLQAI